jgi:hypothetical protein
VEKNIISMNKSYKIEIFRPLLIMFDNTNINKLITKDDPFHFHKFLGIFSITHYIYRYYLLIIYGSMFLNTTTDLYIVAIHGILSLSSLIFSIPMKRHSKLPMIYPEFRLHSIVFGMRSVICCFIDFYGGIIYYKIGICYFTMLIADLITKNHKESANTTMRAMPYSENISEEHKYRITKFHSKQQITATLFMLLNIESAFSPLFAIQIAAFLMTLVRKNIILPNTWHLLYSWALMINILILYTLPLSQIISLNIGIFFFRTLRMKLKINKYISWTIIFSLFMLLDSHLKIVNTYKYNVFVNTVVTIYIIKNIYTTRKLYC